MKTERHRIPADKCPRCGAVATGTTGLAGKGPCGPGDYAVCVKCGTPAIFGPDMKLRIATAEDLRKLDWKDRRKIREAEKLCVVLGGVATAFGRDIIRHINPREKG